MNRLLLSAILALPSVMFSQVNLGQIDDFEDYTTRNWTKNTTPSNTNIDTGGPAGAGDNFLRVQSNASTDPYFGLMTFNQAQWTGNYISKGITYISMDVRNSGENVIFLRLTFYSGGGSYWSTINPVAVLPGQGWKKINFAIDQSSVVAVNTSSTYANVFANIGGLMILHNDSPDDGPDPSGAMTLDIDNIEARNSPLGVSDIQSVGSLKIVPNPANQYFQIDGLSKKSNVMIFNSAGQIVKNISINSQEKIDIQNLEKGVYFIQAETEKGEIYTDRLIKN